MEAKQNKNLFFTRCHVDDKVCNLVIDRKYWINMVSTIMVEECGLSVIELRKPYVIASLEDPEFKDMPNYLVTKQVRVPFTIEEYKDEVLCEAGSFQDEKILYLDVHGGIIVKQSMTTATIYTHYQLKIVKYLLKQRKSINTNSLKERLRKKYMLKKVKQK
jgi:hypothetical protein